MKKVFMLIKKTIANPLGDISEDPRVFNKAGKVLQFFYYALFFFAVLNAMWITGLLELNTDGFSPIWPLFWAKYFSYPTAVIAVITIFVLTTLVGALFYWSKIGRLLAFLGIFQFHAFDSSFGHPSHQWYLWLYTAFWFLFLPNLWPKSKANSTGRKKIVLIFWAAQALILLTYSMSGLYKVVGAFIQMGRGELHAFSPEALALQITDMTTIMKQKAPVGEFFINNIYLGWPLYVGGLLLELFAFWAALRPSLHRLWSVSLIIFHLGAELVFRINFYPAVMLLIILFFDSPLAREGSWRKVVSDIPIVGWVYSSFYTKS